MKKKVSLDKHEFMRGMLEHQHDVERGFFELQKLYGWQKTPFAAGYRLSVIKYQTTHRIATHLYQALRKKIFASQKRRDINLSFRRMRQRKNALARFKRLMIDIRPLTE